MLVQYGCLSVFLFILKLLKEEKIKMKLFIDVTLTKGVLYPEEVTKLIDQMPVEAGGTEGVILSGRMPVWAFSALVHHFHPRPFVATFDPRLAGGVVVASHMEGVNVGDVVDVTDADRVEVKF